LKGGDIVTTQPIERILVATDGSEAAREAVELGVDLASSQDAEVIFLHVAPPTVWRYSRMAPASAIPRQLPAPELDDALRDALARATEAGVEARLALLSGNAAREIVSAADILEVDLVVVGKSGRNPLREHVGSTVARRSERPVLVARRQARKPSRMLLKKAA
jgi:nucleotide-binding universal stress UspA family protein